MKTVELKVNGSLEKITIIIPLGRTSFTAMGLVNKIQTKIGKNENEVVLNEETYDLIKELSDLILVDNKDVIDRMTAMEAMDLMSELINTAMGDVSEEEIIERKKKADRLKELTADEQTADIKKK